MEEPSENLTPPVGVPAPPGVGVTVAVRVTLAPVFTLLDEALRVVVVVAGATATTVTGPRFSAA
jgi:hypothetical protein